MSAMVTSYSRQISSNVIPPAKLPRMRAIGNRVPRILYLNGCAAILESMTKSGADVLSIDWRIPISEARKRVGDKFALQGNLDPCLLFGSKERLVSKTKEILQQAGPVGHILNLGHGILPNTPVENAQLFVETGQQALFQEMRPAAQSR